VRTIFDDDHAIEIAPFTVATALEPDRVRTFEDVEEAPVPLGGKGRHNTDRRARDSSASRRGDFSRARHSGGCIGAGDRVQHLCHPKGNPATLERRHDR
jgi:hypothetical protein